MNTWSSRAQKRSRTRRRARATQLTGIWGAISAVCGVLTAMFQTIELIVTLGVLLVITLATLFTGKSVAVPTRAVEVRKTTSSRGSTNSRRTPGKAGTPGKPRKRPRCGARCQKSVKPVGDCHCACNGKGHGKKISRSDLQSTELKTQERKVVRQQRKATS